MEEPEQPRDRRHVTHVELQVFAPELWGQP